MKKYILLLLVSIITVAGCKKDKLNNTKANTRQFQGKWKVTYTKNTSLKNGQVVETQEEPDGLMVFEFTGNTLTLNENGKITDNYLFDIEGDELVIRENGDAIFFKYKFASGTQLELSQSETVTQNNVTYEDKQTYVMIKI
ncbi:hypothetical protein ABIE26_002265 [Pedobacter africanus]|uniref:Uncharacterized protein n=1 Tax=Pedobacter africanus TaxID=151894 RepID=A0ACC6KYP6_9SPHI|nr:hypothetical protein [Pedobacter africanus]MDR6784346.1 hypothetical protein [Pedobacter africanus]